MTNTNTGLVEDTSAQDQHNAIWTPVLAAHRVAAALRTIAEALPHLSAQAADPLYDLFENRGAHHADGIKLAAVTVEQAAPLPVTLTNEDRQAVFDMHYDMANDMSSKDTAHAMFSQMNDADIAECAAQMALDEMLEG
jgi:hypothetical protein